MDAERWQRIDALFEALLELPEEQHDDFLHRSCGDDQEVRQEVERLLDLERRAGNFWTTPVARLDEPPEVPKPPPKPEPERQRVGPYRLLKLLGRGGMGAVYLGQRDDQSFERQVAVKVIRADRQQTETRRRFRAERQVLAGLVHPNIARLYDGGTTEDGCPYLVMEYVEGWPLDTFCDRHRWTVRQRLELFRQVCDAVHYAHRNLVVHRDLKPGNILVTAEGVPKLLDFGIAKMLDGAEWASLGAETRTGWSPMTPSYASPEQIRGEPITTASDTFALGVILYRLLTGVAPFGASSDSNHQLERAILEEEPPRASLAVASLDEGDAGRMAAARRAGVKDLERVLRGDLDTILAMALRKESERRYGTASALAEDLTHYLEDRPVKARPETLAYRFGKLVRRNRLASATATALLLALVTFAWVSTVQNTRLEEQRDIAQSERATAEDERLKAQTEKEKAEQISRFLLQLFSDADPKGDGGELTVRQVLDRGAEKIEALEDQPPIQAAYMDVIGKVYRSLGHFEPAETLLEGAHQRRLDLYGEHHEEVLESLDSLAGLRQDQGDYDTAEELFRQVLTGRRELLGEGHPAVAQSLNNLALLLYDQGDYAAAEPIYLELLQEWERFPGVEPSHLAKALNNLGLLVHDLGRLDEAEGYYRRSLDLKRQIGESEANISTSLHNLATVLLDQKKYQQAAPFYLESLEIRRRVYGSVHPAVAVSLNNLGVLYYEDGQWPQAEASFVEAIKTWGSTVGVDHPRHAITSVSYARLLLAREDLQRAASVLGPALQVLEEKLPPDHWRVFYAQLLLASCWSRDGELERADAWIARSYEPIAEQLGAEESRSRDALTLVIEHFERHGMTEKAAHYRSLL